MREPVAALAESLSLIWKADRVRTVLVATCQLLTSVGLVGEVVWLKILVDGVASHDTAQTRIGVTLASLGALLVGSCWHVVATQRPILMERARLARERQLLDLVAQARTIELYEDPEYQDFMALVRADLDAFNRNGWTAVGLVTLGAEIVLSAIAAASVHPVLLLLPAAAVPALWTTRRAAAVAAAGQRAAAEHRRLETHLSTLLMEPVTAGEIRVLGIPEPVAFRATQLLMRVRKLELTAEVKASVLRLAGQLFFTAVHATAIVLTVALANSGKTTVGDFLLVLGIAGGVRFQVAGVTQIGASAYALVHARQRLHRLREMVDQQPSDGDLAAPSRLVSGIELAGLSFTYPRAAEPALRDITVSLPAGSIVALVGPNGGGKSTLVKLLFALYRPDAGRIDVDGVDLARIGSEQWWASTSAGFQDASRLEFLVRESVGAGDLPRIADDRAVWSSLAQADAHAMVAAYPGGLEAQLGRQFGGLEPSGGQWQKLAIARALMRGRPVLVALDEPASALDPMAEHELLEAFVDAARAGADSAGSVTLLISHRLSAARLADLIVVVERGRIVQVGSHDTLVGAAGLYSELYHLQARGYDLADGMGQLE